MRLARQIGYTAPSTPIDTPISAARPRAHAVSSGVMKLCRPSTLGSSPLARIPSQPARSRRPAVSVEPTVALRVARELMLTRAATHAVVIDPELQRPIGIHSTLDIAGVLAGRDVSN